MKVRVAKEDEIKELSDLSVSLGNIPLFPGQSIVSVLLSGERLIGFAAVQAAWHAAGSWVREDHRLKGYSRILRQHLEWEMKNRGVPVYFALPGSDFEKMLFAKYGPVKERTVQVKVL